MAPFSYFVIRISMIYKVVLSTNIFLLRKSTINKKKLVDDHNPMSPSLLQRELNK